VAATVIPATPLDPASALASGPARIFHPARILRTSGTVRIGQASRPARASRAQPFYSTRTSRTARLVRITRPFRPFRRFHPAEGSRAAKFLHSAWALCPAFCPPPVFRRVRTLVSAGLPGAVRARSVRPAPRIRALDSWRTLGPVRTLRPDRPAGLTHASSGPAPVRPARVRSDRLDRRGVLRPRLSRERPGLRRP